MINYFYRVIALIRGRSGIKNSGLFFQILTRWTLAVLVIGSALQATNEYFGHPIDCIADNAPTNVVNRFCFVMGTYSLPREADLKMFRKKMFRNHTRYNYIPHMKEGKEKHYYRYYMWVQVMLVMQGMFSYFPAFLWHYWEGNFTKNLLNNESVANLDVETKVKGYVNLIIKRANMHRAYVASYWICEILCFVVSLLQLYAMDAFFNGQFFTDGFFLLRFLYITQSNREDTLATVFPRMTKCTFHKFGPSGTMENIEALCILPINIFNEKLYIILWFWFVASAVLSLSMCIYHALLFKFPNLRQNLIINMGTLPQDVIAEVESVLKSLDIGEYWVLWLMRRNIETHLFNKIVQELASKWPENLMQMREGWIRTSREEMLAKATNSGDETLVGTPSEISTHTLMEFQQVQQQVESQEAQQQVEPREDQQHSESHKIQRQAEPRGFEDENFKPNKQNASGDSEDN